jgi:ubiquinone/menaquinone biosynthesis C-methylase UbiE
MIGGLSARVRTLLRRWFGAPYDYLEAYRKVDLATDYWSIVGPESEAEFLSLGAGKRQMLVELGLAPDSRLLDVGCGTGQLTAAVEEYLGPGGAYLGTDIAPEAVTFCRSRFRRSNFRFLQSEMTSLPIADDRFDFIYFGSVFTHMYPPEIHLMLVEVRRLLASGGCVIADAFLTDVAAGSRGDRRRVLVDEAGLLRTFAATGFSHQVIHSWPCEAGVRRAIFQLRPEGGTAAAGPSAAM